MFPVSTSPEPSPQALLALLQCQRAAFLRDGPPTLAQRRADLLRLKQQVLRHKTHILQALDDDFGHRASFDSELMERLPLVLAIKHQLKHLARWMAPVPRPTALHFQPGRSWVQYQPLGVVGIVSPWNYPLQLALLPLATALAAGNRAILKPSEHTPATSALLEILLAEVFPTEQVAVVSGGAQVGQAFAALPFDHLVFTGSTAVGRQVMRAASEHLVPLTLELGGKSPVIVDVDHPIDQAAQAIAHGKLVNAGQTCIAPDHVWLPAEQQQAFVTAYDRAVRALYPQGPLSPQYTAILLPRQHQRLLALLEDARQRGATVLPVGVRPHDAQHRPQTLAPTLVLNPSPDMALMQEEIFGPVLPVLPYTNLDEAIAQINARPRPLALYYFGPEGPHRQRVLDRTTSGNVTINNTLMHFAQDDLPFGGVGPSGMGAYHGIEGFQALSHAKGVHSQGRWNVSDLLRPPHGGLARSVLRLMLR